MEVKPGFWDPEEVSLFPGRKCPFNRGNRYKDNVNSFLEWNFVSSEWNCLLNRDVPKDRFHCNQVGKWNDSQKVDVDLLPIK